MPQQVPIQVLPNQEFSISLNGNLFDITLKTTDGVTSVSMVINGIDTIDNLRCVAGSPLIPSRYEEAGNFMFLTLNEALPIYTEFNTSQILAYFTAAELAVYRAPPALQLTADYFNPLGALPLRFAPQGYALAS